jgi:pimeloyl-ACP methyl ester carboxylesterase
MTKYFFALIVISSLWSCSPSYYKKISKTPASTTATDIPDYSNIDMWAAHPYKIDPSDSIPRPFRHEWKDSTIDVFFLHPTTFTDHSRAWQVNADVYNDTLNAKTDYSSILYQATIFNQQARVFAPRYRQAHYDMYSYSDTARARVAFETAYSDIRRAFIYYLEHHQGRPIIIAGHSQGAQHAKTLIREFFDGQLLKNRLVAAYLIGMPVRSDEFKTIPPCRDSLQTGCFVAWRTFQKNYEGPAYLSREANTVVTNPLSWKTDSGYANRALHKGAILYQFNKLFKSPNDARVHGSILWVSKPKFPGAMFYRSKNYHIGDLNLFYANVREDVRRRIGLFWK